MFLDSNVFIHAFVGQDSKGEASKRLVRRILLGEQKACTSPMVIDEVLYNLSDFHGEKFALGVIAKILQTPHIEVLAIDKSVCRMLEEAVKEGLAAHDAFHVAVMRTNGIEVICSYDRDFDGIKGIRRQEPK